MEEQLHQSQQRPKQPALIHEKIDLVSPLAKHVSSMKHDLGDKGSFRAPYFSSKCVFVCWKTEPGRPFRGLQGPI